MSPEIPVTIFAMEKRGIRHPTNAMSVFRLEEKPNPGKRSMRAAEPSSFDPGNDLVSEVKETAPDDSVHHRYRSMPAVIRARRIFLGILAKTCADMSTERTVARFLEVTSGYYLNTDQYHNAEHAFFVGAYHVALLGKAGLLSEDRQILRASIRGLFHDSGNALHPEIRPERKGQDELRAALLLLRETNTAMLRAESENAQPIEESIRRINHVLVQDTPPGEFVTLFYGMLNTRTKELTYVNAGHNPPYLYDLHTDEIVALSGEGPVVGILDDYPFQADGIALRPGQLVVFYTDGVTESMNHSDEQFGDKRLKELIRENAIQSAQTILDHIYAKIVQHVAGAPQHDDLTMVIMKISE